MSDVQLPLPARLAVAAQSSFVGRRVELAALERVWTSVSEDSRQVVFVSGEPGVGKSRLLAEVAAVLHRHGAIVLLGTSYADLGVPYQPIVEALEHLLGESPAGALASSLPAEAARLLRLTPLVRRHGTDLTPLPPEAPESRRDLFDAVRDLLLAVCGDGPLVLVLEDLHWAGEPTLQLLSHLVQSTARGRLLVLASYRTTAPDRSASLTHLVADLYRQDGVHRLDLGGLDTSDVTEYLIREAAVDVPTARRSAALLRDQTGGNPFFLRELWRDLAARGGVEVLDSPNFRAPESVRDTLAQRLSSLTDVQADVVELAAVLGQGFDIATLVEAAERDATPTLAAIDLGVSTGFFEADGEAAFRFPHALARQAVLDRIPPSRRIELHARVVHALSRRDTDDPATTARLAHHASKAHVLGLTDEALGYLQRAAEQARRSFAYEEASDLLQRAATLARTGRQREELLLSGAFCRLLAGDFVQAMALYERLARSADDTVQMSAAIGYEEASWHPGLPGDRAVELLRAALRRGEADLGSPEAVRALASLGRALRFAGSGQAAEVSERALALARECGDDELIAHALTTSLWNGLGARQVLVQIKRATELAGLAMTLGDERSLGPASVFQSVAAYTLGDPTLLAVGTVGTERASRTTGEAFYRYMHGCREYGGAFVRGDFALAERIATALLDLGDASGREERAGPHGMQSFMVRRETGALEQVRPLVTGAESPEEHWAPGLLALYTELGMHGPAASLLRGLLDLHVEVQQETAHWPAVLVFLADAALLLGDRRASEEILELLAPYEGLNLMAGQFVVLFGSADRYIAALESLLGAGSADDHFETALAMDERMGAPVHVATTLAAWSLHARRSRQFAEAERYREEALRLARPMGQARVLRALSSAVGSPARAQRYRPDGLTQREIEVLGLVAEGLSNREIGERLFISQNTAANHVRSILGKSGASNRTQAAIYAANHGLLSA